MSGKRKALAFDPGIAPAPEPPAVIQPPAPLVRAKPHAGRKQVGARIPAALYRQLKSHAALEGKLVQELVEQAIDEFLNRSA